MYPDYSDDHKNDQIHDDSITDPSNTSHDERLIISPEGDIDIDALVDGSYYQPQGATRRHANPIITTEGGRKND